MTDLAPRDRLIIPLDVSDVETARAMVQKIGADGNFYKIGYQLGYAGGFAYARELIDAGKQVFMDLKLLDIDNTVEKGVASIADMGATFLTVHAYPKAMRAALKGRGTSALKILGVTVLTSMDDADLQAAGYQECAADLVARRVADAATAGMDGIVCSAQEAGAMRALAGNDLAIVTPGIRPVGADIGDQKRVMTPAAAIQAGADYLVVGRPITADPDPAAAAKAVLADIEAGLTART